MSLSISEVAGQIGLRPSATRYYEQIGVLPPAQRVSGQRRYDVTMPHRLTLIQRARQTGLKATSITGKAAAPSSSWQALKFRNTCTPMPLVCAELDQCSWPTGTASRSRNPDNAHNARREFEQPVGYVKL